MNVNLFFSILCIQRGIQIGPWPFCLCCWGGVFFCGTKHKWKYSLIRYQSFTGLSHMVNPSLGKKFHILGALQKSASLPLLLNVWSDGGNVYFPPAMLSLLPPLLHDTVLLVNNMYGIIFSYETNFIMKGCLHCRLKINIKWLILGILHGIFLVAVLWLTTEGNVCRAWGAVHCLVLMSGNCSVKYSKNVVLTQNRQGRAINNPRKIVLDNSCHWVNTH